MISIKTVTFLFAAATTLASVSFAQTIDTGIVGTVTDPAGGVITAANIRVTQVQTGVARTLTTNQNGLFEIRYLVPGEYSVDVQAPGFRSERRTGILIQLGQQARVEFTLQVGDVQQTVEVTAAAPLLQTENATLGEVVTQERILNLPLNGRSFTNWPRSPRGVRVVDRRSSPPPRTARELLQMARATSGCRSTWMV